MVVTGTHNPYLVALSILVAAFASYTALDLGGHVAAARGLARRVWLGAAAITMGGGIWSMHFVATPAHEVTQPIAAAAPNAQACLRWLTGDHPNLQKARAS